LIVKLYKKSRKSKFIRKSIYRGRFAPSPSGPLHYGSLVTALASYLQARVRHGEWYVRIEDIDPPREIKGASSTILDTLSDYGFEWNSTPIFQHCRMPYYRYMAHRFVENGYAYYCECSRKELAHQSTQGPMGLIYPDICTEKNLPYQSNYSIRIKTESSSITYIDGVFGLQRCNLKKESGDYIIYRTDDLPSYILAVSLDDLFEGYTEIVRGYDLLDVTPRQLHLGSLLQADNPVFMHIPVIVDDSNKKLSKQTHAPEIKKHQARDLLINALIDLGQDPPRSLRWRPLWTTWTWAMTHWNANLIPRSKSVKFRG
jgi:glutamyl-Q tRNA(Asp) synthetase